MKRRYPPHAWSRPGYAITFRLTSVVRRAAVLRNARTRRSRHAASWQWSTATVRRAAMWWTRHAMIAGCKRAGL